jgi:hypothetical protein
VFQIFGHANLTHESVFVSVHSCQVTDVTENVLKAIRQLKSIDLAESILHMRIDYQLHKLQYLST